MSKQVVLISGKQGSGKTTLADHLEMLCRSQGPTPCRLKYGGVLYELHDLIVDRLFTYGVRPKQLPDKRLCQLLGTDWGRNTLGEDVWVRVLQAKVAHIEQVPWPVIFIIDDCRFPNEMTAFPPEESHTVRLYCDRDIRKQRCASWREDEHHPSETGLDAWDAAGKFDISLNTGLIAPDRAAQVVMCAIQEKLGASQSSNLAGEVGSHEAISNARLPLYGGS